MASAQTVTDSDPYRSFAGRYDRLFEPMNKGLRLAGVRMFRPSRGMNILDVGCGTGTHLDLYRRFHCNLYGIDASFSMLAIARERLGEDAQLHLGSAATMPYEDGFFDLVIAMLTLHELDAPVREDVLREMKRVLRPDGRLLLIDFHTGPYRPLQGWWSRLVILASELAAGRRHYGNQRQFMRAGGLRPLLPRHALQMEGEKILAGGTLAVCTVSLPPGGSAPGDSRRTDRGGP